MSTAEVLLFVATFLIMEFTAWALHKYAMHGPLWWLHKDHHEPVPTRSYQLNDAFAIFFAVPSFLSLLFGNLYEIRLLSAFGFGIMAYGIVYFFVHEVIIHRRWITFKTPQNWYIEALNVAHKIHHSKKGKEDCENFGMLIVKPSYFVAALRRRQARRI